MAAGIAMAEWTRRHFVVGAMGGRPSQDAGEEPEEARAVPLPDGERPPTSAWRVKVRLPGFMGTLGGSAPPLGPQPATTTPLAYAGLANPPAMVCGERKLRRLPTRREKP